MQRAEARARAIGAG